MSSMDDCVVSFPVVRRHEQFLREAARQARLALFPELYGPPGQRLCQDLETDASRHMYSGSKGDMLIWGGTFTGLVSAADPVPEDVCAALAHILRGLAARHDFYDACGAIVLVTPELNDDLTVLRVSPKDRFPVVPDNRDEYYLQQRTLPHYAWLPYPAQDESNTDQR